MNSTAISRDQSYTLTAWGMGQVKIFTEIDYGLF